MKGIFEVHCHILPGVDDGADSQDVSMKMMEMEYKSGVRNIIFTPHFRRKMFTTKRDIIEQSFRKLSMEASEVFPDLNLYLGCEFHVNMDMTEYLDSDVRYCMDGSRYVLTEFSEMDDYSYICTRINELQRNGYWPIIAHAERYASFYGRFDRIEDLHDSGVMMQINSGSILGKEGRGMKSFCKKLLKRELIDLVGSDAHNLTDRKPDIGECADYVEKKYGSEYARRIFIKNPESITE